MKDPSELTTGIRRKTSILLQIRVSMRIVPREICIIWATIATPVTKANRLSRKGLETILSCRLETWYGSRQISPLNGTTCFPLENEQRSAGIVCLEPSQSNSGQEETPYPSGDLTKDLFGLPPVWASTEQVSSSGPEPTAEPFGRMVGSWKSHVSVLS